MVPNPPDTHYVISVTNPPACVDLKPNVYEVEHQGIVGSCTAHAVVEALEALRKEDYSRLYLYWQTRNGVQNAPKQIGTNVRDTLRAAVHFGVPLETDWPYLEANVDEQPSDAVVLKAQERKLKRYERVPSVVMPAVFSADALHAYLKSALAEGMPIIATTYIGTALYDLKGPWQTHSYTSVSAGGNPYLGMHAVLIIGYDDACQRYLVQNSWGPDYADGGFFGMPYSVAETDIADAWVIREFYDIAVPVPRPAQALEKITLGLPYAQYKTNSMYYFDRPMVRIDTDDGTMVGMFALLGESVEIQYANLTALVSKTKSGFSVQRKTP